MGKVPTKNSKIFLDSSVDKYPDKLEDFHDWFFSAPLSIVPDPSPKIMKQYLGSIDSEDIPILAGAASTRADFLLTLDRKDFLNNKVLKHKRLTFKIMTPGNFIQGYFANVV